MNKFFLLACTSLLLTHAANAQEFRTKINGKDPKIVVDMQGSDVTVEGIDGNELVIKGDGFDEPPKRAEGLRPIYNSAVDNTKLGLSVTQDGNTVHITRASRKDATYVLRVPRNASVKYKQAGWNGGGDLVVRDVSGDLEVSMTSGDITLKNVAGPVVANTVSGDIQVRFAPMRQGPSAISTVSGDVDVSMPTNTKATLKLRSISGEVYTDFDMNLNNNQNNMQHIGGQVVDGSINGGGNTVALKTVSGDIFVRKAK
jgi:lia operon protein LiaG